VKKLSFILISIASKKYGYGHLNRSISFSKFIQKKHDSKLITFTDEISQKKINKYKPYLLKNFTKILDKQMLEKYDYIIYDISNHLILKNKKIIKYLEKITCDFFNKTIIIDGLKNEMINKNKKIKKRLLICPYLIENNEVKKNDIKTKYLIGPDYFIPNYKMTKLKKNNILKKNIKNLLITFGGSDLECHSIYLVKILLELNLKIKMNVVIGPFYSQKLIALLKEISLKNLNINLIYNPKNIWILMLKNDVIICSSGVTKYETILLGLPSIIFCANKEQRKYNRGFKKKNICITIDNMKNRSEIKKTMGIFLQNYNQRKNFLYKSNKIIDLNGANRILKIVENLKN
tara:strand:- start:220 stop:1260 length:1041 start_codon:yes stop_codon:yes gene_type:complete